jgi:prephenate dehydrogenase
MQEQIIRTISFVGLGLIGASLLQALKQASVATGRTILFQGYDPGLDAEDILCISNEYGLDRFEPEPTKLYDADLIILPAPVLTNIALLEEISGTAPKGTIIADVSSTKSLIAREAKKHGLTFIGMHPLAGREQQGYRAGSASLLAGRVMIICADPEELETPGSRELIDLIESAGCITAIMTPDEHDQVVANISHLPQLVSTAMMAHCRNNIYSSGPGFASVTRLAGSSWKIWQDIIATNSENISRELETFAGTLNELAREIRLHRMEGVESQFREANNLYHALLERNRQ